MIQKLNYIGGEWLAGESEIENRNPSDVSDLIGLYAQASSAQLDLALDAAHNAQTEWARVGIEQRYNALMAYGAINGTCTIKLLRDSNN